MEIRKAILPSAHSSAEQALKAIQDWTISGKHSHSINLEYQVDDSPCN